MFNMAISVPGTSRHWTVRLLFVLAADMKLRPKADPEPKPGKDGHGMTTTDMIGVMIGAARQKLATEPTAITFATE
jgi:hypothetical protein